jgi:signal peptidase II
VTPFRFGLVAGALTAVADQASKLALLFVVDLPVREPIVLGPFVNLIVVWNRGISYGLFQQHSELGRFLLLLVSAIATAAIVFWLRRVQTRLLALALGLIAGGAVGNAVDRLAYGAVFDFVQLHAGTRSWYVFNGADVAIVAGVIGLVLDALSVGRRGAEAA